MSDKTNEKPIQDLLKFSIINLDKPSGPTSFQVSQHVKNIVNATHSGHFGTLDPKVSGVLPIAIGKRACRLNDFFMHKNKTYVGIMHLHEDIDEEKLKQTIKKFIGKIQQLPPIRSRVKRQLREREIVSLNILEREGKDVLFETEVQAGTYIRKLCDDIGKFIGGAHMLELRRTKAGIFSETDSNFVNLYDLEKAFQEYQEGNEEKLRKILIPAEIAIKKVMPFIDINESLKKQLLIGKPLMKSDIQDNLPEEDTFAIFNKNNLIAIMKKSEEGEIIARPLFVYN